MIRRSFFVDGYYIVSDNRTKKLKRLRIEINNTREQRKHIDDANYWLHNDQGQTA